MKLTLKSCREQGIGAVFVIEDGDTGARCEVQISRREAGSSFMSSLALTEMVVRRLLDKVNAMVTPIAPEAAE